MLIRNNIKMLIPTLFKLKKFVFDQNRNNYKSVLLVLTVVLLVILILLLLALRSDKRANERQELISETERDSVTGLYTRNFFFAYADRVFKEHPAEKRDAIVLNVEQFHMINALYGWEFGDRVLKAIGDEITAFLRENAGSPETVQQPYDHQC